MPKVNNRLDAAFFKRRDVLLVMFDGCFIPLPLLRFDARPLNANTQAVEVQLFSNIKIFFIALIMLYGIAANVVIGVLGLVLDFLPDW